jgi:DnaJ like chaperone protein
VIYFPNVGCLIFLLLIAMVGGAPLFVGLARIALFFVAASLLAGTIGSWWLRRRALPRARERHDLFVQTLVALLVRLAEVDGNLDRREVTVIRHFFQHELGYSDEKLLWVKELIQQARGSQVSVAELCQRLTSQFVLQERIIVVEMLGRVARADGVISPAENAMLDEVIQRLGLGPFVRGFQWDFGGRGAGPAPPSPDRTTEAFAVLGLAHGATAIEIKSAWRRLSKENHPDRVTHLGEEFRRVAEQRMRRINAAYDTLKEAGLA